MTSGRRMSTSGHLQTFVEPDRMSGLPSKADIVATLLLVG